MDAGARLFNVRRSFLNRQSGDLKNAIEERKVDCSDLLPRLQSIEWDKPTRL
jgi:hypothetical protein